MKGSSRWKDNIFKVKISKIILMNKNAKTRKGTYFISSLSAITANTEFGVGLIFILFLMNALHFTDQLTSVTYAYVFVFAYLLPIPLGLIQDKFLNNNITVNLGFTAAIISQFLLFLSASMYVPATCRYDTIIFNTQNILFFMGMLFFAFGISFVNLGFSHLINMINDDVNERLNAFSILYAMINFGSIIGIIIMTIFVGDTHYESFKWGFLAYAIFLIIGFISYHTLKSRLLIDSAGKPIEEKSVLDYDTIRNELNLFLLSRIISKTKASKEIILNMNLALKLKTLNTSLSKHEKDRVKVFFLFIVIIIIYRIAFYQSQVSMVFFIEYFVVRDLGFYTIPIQMFLILNPMLVLILGPIIVRFNNALEKRNIELGLTERMVIGLILMALAFVFLSLPGYLIDLHYANQVNCIWIILFALFLSLSEMFFSITGYAVVAQLAPKNYMSVFFGIFLSVRAFAMFFSGIISQFFPEDLSSVMTIGQIPFNGLLEFFSIFIMITLISSIGLLLLKKK